MNRPLCTVSALAFAVLLLQGCAPMVVGGAATGVALAHDRRTTGSFIEDQSIEMKARNELNAEPELSRQAHLSVTSFNMIVLVSGEAPNETLRQRAGEVVGRVEKVRRVHNEVQVAAPSAMMSRSSDTLITAKVKTNLFRIQGMEDFNPTRVKVVTENGTVFLMGLLTRAEADATARTASSVGGVQRVVKLFEYLD
ncbi:MAG: BON domain-containing protein [Gammaproteobacteria bacterium]